MSNITVVKKLASHHPDQSPKTRPGQERYAIVSQQVTSNGTTHYVPDVQVRRGGVNRYEGTGDRQPGDPFYTSKEAAIEVAKKFR